MSGNLRFSNTDGRSLSIDGVFSGKRMETSTHVAGFTLIELMVTVVVAGVLLTLAVPSFRAMVAANRATALANEMVTALNLARSEAVKRGAPVTICRGDGCDATDWADGWAVFVDTNANGALDDGELLRQWSAVKGDPQVTLGASSVTFNNLGAPGAAVTVDITLPGCQGEQGRRINVSPVGRISMIRVACG